MYDLPNLPVIPGLKDPNGGPIRNILNQTIGSSDPMGLPLSSVRPRPVLASGLPAMPGSVVHDALGRPVGTIGPLGTSIVPLPW